MTRYFAYGANMDPVHMREWCPGARRLGAAVLPSHRLRIGAAGYGTAVPDPSGTIHGVLWDLGAADEAALDRFEGISEGAYRKASAVVLGSDGAAAPAMLYCAADPAPGTPVPGYLERVIEVAESEGFPERYLAELRALVTPR